MTRRRYLSLCSGIGGDAVAYRSLGWSPVAFAETGAFASAVLAHRFPGVPNIGDLRAIDRMAVPHARSVSLVSGGTPCQSFSTAGRRAGLDDPRGQLAFEFLRVVAAVGARWFVWENVPGALSADDGRAVEQFLGTAVQLGYSCAWRVLDAQHFGVPQRRRRLFVVGRAGDDWRAPAAALFDAQSVSGHPPPESGSGAETAACLTSGDRGGGAGGRPAGRRREDDVNLVPVCDAIADTITASASPQHGHQYGLVGFDLQQLTSAGGMPMVAATLTRRWDNAPRDTTDNAPRDTTDNAPRDTTDCTLVPVWMPVVADPVTAHTLSMVDHAGNHAGNNGGRPHNLIATRVGVRRLTVLELERLQGFPDGYTAIPWRGRDVAADRPRGTAIGNAMPVPVMAWIGRRIDMVDRMVAARNRHGRAS